jgi:hypothetical protein
MQSFDPDPTLRSKGSQRPKAEGEKNDAGEIGEESYSLHRHSESDRRDRTRRARNVWHSPGEIEPPAEIIRS